MRTIAVIITDDFEDSEYTKPAEAFRQAGYELLHIGPSKGATVKGKKQGTPVVIDALPADVRPEDFDALLIPGGYSPDKLRVDDNAVAFTRDFTNSGRPIFAICHAPQLLITAQVLKGRTITAYKSIVQDIKNAGAIYVDREVVQDGNLITSRHPGDIPAFIDACLKRLGREEAKAA